MNVDEYEKMFRLEGRLWWYKILHERVAEALTTHFGTNRNVAILDLGCGTGGLLNYLHRQGYTHLRGLDGSADAVAFCHERGLAVSQLDLNQLTDFEPATNYDAIVCNDVFCYFDDPALTRLLSALAHRLKPGGLLISNNNAFNVFRGQHDLAVGSSRRFVVANFERLLPPAGLRIGRATYWSLALSPLILLMRQWQSLQLKMGWRTEANAQSDVYLPAPWLNETLYRIVKVEQKLLPRTPFGSSLFVVGSRGEGGKV
ncbi:class I SAM-dependent DNA methyltransferase [Spirosoma montaniterrae]|uniref:Chemotaxis protein CheR n=1 Tax=Spirosoma montaniterrae TaxID=1178516 RepID=A0A1P9WY76_9BACT|nr:class I SAM-dependent methyltransferase [Spirosoma montaniterrae]AQG80342.1 chemotaxis protein CheR [Spirosoma montaniterrae]